MNRAMAVFDRLIEWIALLLTGAMIGIVFVNVVFRYFLSAPIFWADELSRYLFVWCVFLGASIGVKREAHFGLELLTEWLPKRVRTYMVLITHAIVIVVLVFLFANSLKVVRITKFQRSPALRAPMPYVYSAFPVGMVLMGYYEVLHVIELLKGLLSSRQHGGGQR